MNPSIVSLFVIAIALNSFVASTPNKVSRVARDTIVGGKQPIPTDDPEVLRLVEAGLATIDGQSSLANKVVATNVISATRQVVAGYSYDIKVAVAESTCSKSDSGDRTDCVVKTGAETVVCNWNVWERVWLNSTQITITCENGQTYSSQ